MSAPAKRRLTIRFLDDEVIEGAAADASLDTPDIHLEIASGTNNMEAWIPLPAVKKINFEAGPADKHVATADKMVALRFQDGEVMRGYLNGGLDRRRFGMVIKLYSTDRRQMQVVGVPYTSLKALFYVRTWDGRPLGYQDPGAPGDAPLLQLVGDINEVTRMYRLGSISHDEFMEHRRRLLDHF